MKTKIFLIVIVLGAFFYGQAESAFFEQFGKECLVVVGKDASPEEKALGDKIATRLREGGNQAENIVITDAYADMKADISGTNHLVAIGTYANNLVLRKSWSSFALDRWEYYKSNKPLYEGQETEGFYVFGFGNFKNRGVGYIEAGRNHYWIIAKEKGNDKGYRVMVMITGDSPAGVVAAGEEFLRSGLLNGVVINPEKVIEKSSVFTNGSERYVYDIPEWIPANIKDEGKEKIAYIGWSMVQSILYSGFLEASGRKPLRMWRVKYHTGLGFSNLETKLHQRFTGNELLVIEFNDEKTAAEALNGYKEGVLRVWEETPSSKNDVRIFYSGSQYLVKLKNFIVMETLPDGYDTLIINEMTGKFR